MDYLHDDDQGALDLVLGHVHHLLGEDGDVHAQRLVASASLRLWQNGGWYRPDPGDNWTEKTYDATLLVDPVVLGEFTPEVRERIWPKVEAVLIGRGRHDVTALAVERGVAPSPEIAPDWRARAAQGPLGIEPSNQARNERAKGGYPERDKLVFGSFAERALYDALVTLQHECPVERTFAIAPSAGVKLRDAGVKTPDFLVIGNGRAVVIEMDGPHHYTTSRKADDATRDRHWSRCDVYTVRIVSEQTEDAPALVRLLREELRRRLWRSH